MPKDEITLKAPKNLVVIKDENPGQCRTPECASKTLYWALNPKTNKRWLISQQIDGTWIQHFLDCPGAKKYSASKKVEEEKQIKLL